MSRRPLYVLLAVALLVAGAVGTVRWTGAGAVALGPGGELRALPHPLAFAPRWRERVEPVVLAEDGALRIERELAWQTPEGATFRGRLRLVGWPPARAGAWLDREAGLAASLERRANEIVRAAPGSAAGERRLREELTAEGWKLAELTADVELGGVRLPPTVPALAAAPRRAPVLLLGLDGLDETLVGPMIARGELPTLARLAAPESSALGTLDPFEPLLSPLLWTTMATGVGPEEHGILDFLQATGETRNGQPVLTPVMSTSRRAPALWNLTSAAGRRAAVIGWWATFPAEAVRGVVVSDRASAQLFIGERANLRGEGVLYPSGRAGELERLLVLDSALPDAELARFVRLPAGEIAARRAADDGLDPVVQLVRLLASTRSYLGLAEHLWRTDRPDLMLLYLEGTDTVGHLFGPYHPPRSPWIDAREFERYRDAVSTFYRDLDSRLAPLVAAAAAAGATIVVVSDHGFAWGHDRPHAESGTRTATAALWHRDRAIFWVHGPGARPGGRGTGSLYDVEPTLLALLGLPAGEGMPGQPLEWALAEPAPAERFDYRAAVPAVGATAAGAAQDDAGSAELMAKLQALGYIGGTERASEGLAGGAGEAAPASGLATKNSQLNLGTVLLEKGDAEGALRAYQAAADADPGDAGARNKVALALAQLGRHDESIASYRAALERARLRGQREAAWLGIGIAERALGRKSGARDAFLAGTREIPDSFPLLSNLAQAEHALADEPATLAALERARALEPNDFRTLNLIAALEAKRGRTGIARRLWQQSLALEPEQPQIREFLRLMPAGPP